MKRITLSLTMALGCLMTTQSFGFDLLDRMMGSKGCGCDTACCDTPVVHAPAHGCGCEAPGLLSGLKGRGCGIAAPGCGCEAPACGCAADPSCGVAAPACGCEAAACGCDSVGSCLPRPGGLLTKLFSRNRGCGCDAPCAAEPACGIEPACGCAAPARGCEAPCGCDSVCGKGCGLTLKRPGLLNKLFSSRHSSCCDAPCDSGCGCAAPVAVPVSVPAVQEVPSAPAPIVDPSASLQTKSRVLQASARYVR
ncbi:MAG: hypothetical protein EA381_11485 [Planctomycetaceae bacterium]|nr:MAG: hypothetical protein EA381_11485 [Planctomycetaceae bacterium]